MHTVRQIQKRDNRIVPFDPGKITSAIHKAMLAASEGSREEAEALSVKVSSAITRLTKRHEDFIPTVEGVQDMVEKELMLSGHLKTAKAYILYRDERAKLRAAGVQVPEKVRELAEQSKNYFRNPLGEFVYYRTYARWIDAEERRETWIETVDRYMAYMKKKLGGALREKEYEEVRNGILRMEAMPSMRLLQFAGKAAEATNVCAYNCSYIAPESFQDLAEIMYISMCGTGVGWSVESKNVQKLPQIKPQTGAYASAHLIPDSKEGWADALALGMKTWASGKDIDFDYSRLRPAGSRLATMGGKASGPEPLRRLLEFTRAKMLARQGRRLRNIDVHDIICMIGDCVVAGGVRRSAMISLSDLDDADIRNAKSGAFYIQEPQRMLSNNSAVYDHRPSNAEFMEEWLALMKSGSGERGIFNRGSLAHTLPARRLKTLKGRIDNLGTNPCGEIILQSKQFCNLSEVVARREDTRETLLAKIRLASILGTYQSSLTYFPYLSPKWKKNCESERLLGVSITGQWDCPLLRDSSLLQELKEEALRTNKRYAEKLGIPASTCVTCVKPSGTLSQMADCSSGMHPRHAPYYIRRIRIAASDALFKMLRDQGVPYHPEVGQSPEGATTYVLEFPVKAPEGSVFKNSLTAIEQLEHWKLVKQNYTEHNPSVTISVGEDEWIAVGNWVYANWDMVGGLSFLPRDNHVYPLAPYEEISKEKYEELSERLQHLDYSKIITYEKTDELDLKRELACSGGTCELH